MRNAFSSSGELNWFTWEDYAPQPLIDRFQADTGIKLNVTTYSSNGDCLNIVALTIAVAVAVEVHRWRKARCARAASWAAEAQDMALATASPLPRPA